MKKEKQAKNLNFSLLSCLFVTLILIQLHRQVNINTEKSVNILYKKKIQVWEKTNSCCIVIKSLLSYKQHFIKNELKYA